jgi:hypothetical protein
MLEMKISTTFIVFCVAAMLASFACRKSSTGAAGVIRSISPDSGHFGTVLTIRGTGFDVVNGYVTMDGVMAPIKQITDSTIILTVPTTHTAPVVVKATTGGSTTGPTFNYADDILVAGVLTLYPSGYNPSFAFYWDNGIPFLLETVVAGQVNAAATGIASSGDDIYVCGYQYYGIKRYAIVWKNGAAESLSNITTQDAQAYAIQVSGQHVYVVGYLNNGNHDVATVWVDGQVTALLGDTVNSYANAITIVGNDVYIAGYRTQSNSTNRIALYWKNGTATTLSDGNLDALTTGVAVVGADLYISGNMGGGVLWKDGIVQSLSYSTAGLCSYNTGLFVAGESSSYYSNSSNVWAWGTGNTAYNLGDVSVAAVTADSSGVYTANTSPNGNTLAPSYSACTGANPVITIPLSTYTTQGFGSASAICVRH